MSGKSDALIAYLLTVTQSRRHFTDFLFKVILAAITVIIVSPFFLILIQLTSLGFWQVFGNGPGQGLELFTTFPGVGLQGGIRRRLAFVLSQSVGWVR